MRSFFLFLALFLTTTFCFSQQATDTTGLYSAGINKIASGDYAGAVRDFNGILRLVPGNADALTGRALARYYLNDFVSARTDIDKALAVKNEFPFGHYTNGLVYMGEKSYEKALDEFHTALNQQDNYPEAYSAKLICMHSIGKGKDKTAFELAEKAVDEHPNVAIYYYTRGLFYSYRDKPEKAIADFSKAKELDTSHNLFNIYLNRGNAYLSIQEFEKATTDLTDAIAINPDNASVYHSRGLVYYQKQEYEQCIQDFNKSLTINPNNASGHLNVGMAYYKQSNTKDACKHFRKSCELQNKNACRMVIMNCTGN
jgi:tetratricopeptide (TPR) repeat protein